MRKFIVILFALSCSTVAVKAQVREVTQETWSDLVANASRPVVIDFYADWCGPCRQYSPVVERLSYAYRGRVDFYKVDIDTHPVWCEEMEITCVPTTIILYTSEGDYYHKTGYMNASALREGIDRAIRASDF